MSTTAPSFHCPPEGYGCYNKGNLKHGKYAEFTFALKQLKLGEYVEVERVMGERSSHWIARKLDIKVSCRRCGSKTTTRIYRTK